MPFVNTEAVVKTATLCVSGLSLTGVPAMLNGTLRVSKYFPAQPVSPSELSFYFFSRSVCLFFMTPIDSLILMYFLHFLFVKSSIDDKVHECYLRKMHALKIELLINCQIVSLIT